MRKTSNTRGIREDESYSDAVLTWAASKYPTVDVPSTFEIFADHCRAHGSNYACFDAALRTWIRNGVDKGYGGVVFKTGRAADPKWAPILAEAKAYGFREPQSHETPGSYRTEFETWKRVEKKSTPVVNFAAALKKVS